MEAGQLTTFTNHHHLPEHEKVLDHFLPKVVVDAVDLLLLEETGEMFAQFRRAVRVLTKRLLNNDTRPTTEKKTIRKL